MSNDSFRLKAAFFAAALFANAAFAANRPSAVPLAQARLKKLVAELRASPGDAALREEIIALSLTLKPRPKKPAEAVRFEGRAEYVLKNAKAPVDYARAADEYAKALLAAPWVAEDYLKQSAAFEKAGDPAPAKRSLELYLLAAPEARDSEEINKRIAGLEMAAEDRVKAAAPETPAPETLAPEAPPDKAGIQWVKIPGGTFTMGSGAGDEGPTHRVAIKSFQMAKTLVTNKQYRECAAAGACAAAASQGSSFEEDDQPVVGVDWNQAKAFSAWAGGRLPSESEWEYAARSAGKDWKYPWGNEDATCERAVIGGCGSTTAPVCSKRAGNTQQGLCDMAGNVWEWVQDLYHGSYNGAPTDGSAWEDAGSNRVNRGGSWSNFAGRTRSAFRASYAPDFRYYNLGFRPAR